MDQEKVVTI